MPDEGLRGTGSGTLDQLPTEIGDADLADTVDSLSTADLCSAFLEHESRVLPAISACLPAIAALIDDLTARFQAGGRIFYVGAGNSARVASMDASELPGTFSVDPARFPVLVAGGPAALSQTLENAEDSEADGRDALRAYEPTSLDSVIGISASGRTPFVMGALQAACQVGALTAGLTGCQPSALASLSLSHVLAIQTGPELVAGSTRLKAGTAAKETLNMISTCTMIRLGKTYRGLMLDVRVRNHKLGVRGRRIIRQVCQSGMSHLLGPHEDDLVPRLVDLSEMGSNSAELCAALDRHIYMCGNSIKLACAVAVSGLDAATAQARLDEANGHFGAFLDAHSPSSLCDPLVLAIDGGGTRCQITVSTLSGVRAHGEAGACHSIQMSVDAIVSQIRLGTVRAVKQLYDRLWSGTPAHERPRFQFPRFARVWAGISGAQNSSHRPALSSRLESLFSVSAAAGSLYLTSDSQLFGAHVAMDVEVDQGIAVVAGTGSAVSAFCRNQDGRGSRGPDSVTLTGRSGGWGYLLGDHGSAYDIGRRAMQAVLSDMDGRQGRDAEPSPLEGAILAHLGVDSSAQLLPSILSGDGAPPRQKIASLAPVVMALAFPLAPDSMSPLSPLPVTPPPNAQARALVESSAAGLVAEMRLLIQPGLCEPQSTALILGGALMSLPTYRGLFLDACVNAGLPQFQKMAVIGSASDLAVELLLADGKAATVVR